MMRYKPLLLALLISFSAPAFAAHNAAKSKENKAQSVKEQNIKSKKDTAKASGNKTSKQTVGKTSGKKTDADEPAGKQSRKGKADNKKNDTRQDKEDDKTTKRDKSEKQENPKSRKGKETLKAKEKTDEDKPSANVKKETAKADRKHKQDADQDDGGRGRKAAKKSDKQAERQENNEQQSDAVIGKNGTPQMRAAVTAAANDLESKKALHNRADALLVHVTATLRQTRNDLAGINRQQRDAWDKFQKLNADLGRLKTEVSSMRAQISRFVSGNYKNSQPNAVALFLKKAEPGQKTRFLRYTRYINTANEQVDGHGRVMGGVLSGSEELMTQVAMYCNSCGLAMSPFNAWVLLSGVETLSVRMEKQFASALKIARWLSEQPQVKAVYYSGLPGHPQAALAAKQQLGGGIVVGFEVDGKDAAWLLLGKVELFSKTANLGDVRSTITHPWTTTHGRMSPEDKQAAGIRPGLLRLAIGLEYPDDLIADLQQAMA